MLDGVLQLADVARPVVGVEQPQRCGQTTHPGGHGRDRAALGNAAASTGMSARRSRSGGTAIASMFRRKYRSSRKRASETAFERSVLVSAIRRASMRRVSLPPSRSNFLLFEHAQQVSPESRARARRLRRERWCPLCAISRRPGLRATAPVNAPLSWPNSSDSTSSLGRLAQSIFRKRRVVARAALVNPARELILARAALAGDQNGG